MFYLLEPDDIVDGEDLESEVLAAGTVATQAHTGEGAWGEVFQQWDKVSGSESLSINIEAISLEPLVEGLLGTGAVVKIHATESNIPYAGVECIDVLFFIILLWLFVSLFGCTLQAPPSPWYSLHGASLKLESSGFAHLAFAKRHIRMHKRHKRHIRMHRMHKAQVLG